MTLVFDITTPKRCEICHGPVRDIIYQHQCRSSPTAMSNVSSDTSPRWRSVQPLSCFTCLVERGICRYCYNPFTEIKYANTSWKMQCYYPPRPRSSEILVDSFKVDLFEDDLNEMTSSAIDFLTSSLSKTKITEDNIPISSPGRPEDFQISSPGRLEDFQMPNGTQTAWGETREDTKGKFKIFTTLHVRPDHYDSEL